MVIFVGIAIALLVTLMIYDFYIELGKNNKIPKARCEQCKNCELIDCLGKVECKYLHKPFTCNKPKRCSHFEKRGDNE